MILKVFKILPFMVASVNPSTFHLDQKKNAINEQSFELITNFTASGNTTTYWDTNYLLNCNKFAGTNQNDALGVQGNIYVQTARNGSQTASDCILPIETNYQSWNYTNLLMVLKVNPYLYLKDVEGSARLKINLNTDLYIDPNTSENRLSIRYDTYCSTETYWDKYLDISNYNTAGINITAINDITNSQLGFIYSSNTTTADITRTGNIGQFNRSIDIDIVSNQTNYIYILVRPYIRNYTSSPYAFITQNGQTAWAEPASQGGLAIWGTKIMGTINYEVVDIPGIMWEVFSMPFTFISVAFNLTLFPGTPYQINISNLFLSIIGIIVFMFILNKLVLKK